MACITGLFINTVHAETAQQAAENAVFSAMINYSVDDVMSHYQHYVDPDGHRFDVVGYDGLDLVSEKNGVETYALTLLLGDKYIPRIEKSCQVYIKVKGNTTTLGKILESNCED